MDHPCYKCGQSVEDGKAFCLQCGAPQIRVAMPEAVPAIAAGAAVPHPIFSSDSPIVPGNLSPASLSTEIVWPRAFRVCLVATGIAILLTALRLIFPLVAVLIAGFLAVIFYRNRNPLWNAGPRAGAQLGALTGLLFSGISAVFAALMLALLQSDGQIRQAMLDALQQTAARSTDPQFQAAFDLLKNPDGLAGKMLGGVLILFVISTATAGLAGAVTGSFLGRRKRP